MEHVTDLAIAERSIIGAVLDPATRALETLELDPADFNSVHCQAVLELVQSMDNAGKAVDPATVAREISESQDFPVRGIDFSWLYQCVTDNTRFGFIDDYVQIVKDSAVKRRVRAAGTRVVLATDEDMPVDDLVDLARREVDQAANVQTSDVETLAQSMARTLTELEKPAERVLSPWADLNALIGGFSPGRLYVVGARPSVGKSVVALQVAMALAVRGFVSFSSLEMSKEEINKRIIAHDLMIEMDTLMQGPLRPEHWDRINAHMDVWARSRLMVNDDSAVSFAGLRRHARSVARRGPLAGVIVDYLQLMTAARGDQRKRHEVVADFSRNLKILARELHVPVIALSQLNRESTSREDKKPRISDLRESGAVEQDADVVILLHRDIQGPESGTLSMGVAKNRQGRTGSFDLDFYGHYSEARTKGVLRRPDDRY